MYNQAGFKAIIAELDSAKREAYLLTDQIAELAKVVADWRTMIEFENCGEPWLPSNENFTGPQAWPSEERFLLVTRRLCAAWKSAVELLDSLPPDEKAALEPKIRVATKGYRSPANG